MSPAPNETGHYLAGKKGNDYVCIDNSHMEVDANSLPVKRLTRSVM